MKSINELHEGECIVITENNKRFKGYYSEKNNCIFFTIPADYKIIGYEQ